MWTRLIIRVWAGESRGTVEFGGLIGIGMKFLDLKGISFRLIFIKYFFLIYFYVLRKVCFVVCRLEFKVFNLMREVCSELICVSFLGLT